MLGKAPRGETGGGASGGGDFKSKGGKDFLSGEQIPMIEEVTGMRK